MAEVLPFRGILYNPNKIQDLSAVVTPPFDVISKDEQRHFHDRHPQNIIRLILGFKQENDTAQDNWYARAATCLNQWLSRGILVQDASPTLYLTAVDFFLGQQRVSRYGLIALVGLEPFEKGIVLPHEKTYSKIKSERLELMKACHANFSPIFSLYPDPDNLQHALKNAVSDHKAEIDFTDHTDQRHRLWRITDPAVHQSVAEAMKGKNIFIADGHHRYETALNYRALLSSSRPDFSKDDPANYVMMYLCSMEDPGLAILPAHRMLTTAGESALASFIQKAEKFFDIASIPFHTKNNGREKARIEFISRLSSDALKNTIGIFMKDRPEFYLLTLKPDMMEQKFGDELSDSLKGLDVIVLTHLVLCEILGLDQAGLDDENLITYSSCEKQAVEMVSSGKCDITFILNPTRIEQVQKVAEEGLIMPRKSTYFFPKVISGQVINKLN